MKKVDNSRSSTCSAVFAGVGDAAGVHEIAHGAHERGVNDLAQEHEVVELLLGLAEVEAIVLESPLYAEEGIDGGDVRFAVHLAVMHCEEGDRFDQRCCLVRYAWREVEDVALWREPRIPDMEVEGTVGLLGSGHLLAVGVAIVLTDGVRYVLSLVLLESVHEVLDGEIVYLVCVVAVVRLAVNVKPHHVLVGAGDVEDERVDDAARVCRCVEHFDLAEEVLSALYG